MEPLTQQNNRSTKEDPNIHVYNMCHKKSHWKGKYKFFQQIFSAIFPCYDLFFLFIPNDFE